MTWATHVLQWELIDGSETARWSKPEKHSLSSDRRLQLAYVKSESLVIAGQHTAVNTFPGLVHTARHTTKVGSAKAGGVTFGSQPSKVKSMIGVKS